MAAPPPLPASTTPRRPRWPYALLVAVVAGLAGFGWWLVHPPVPGARPPSLVIPTRTTVAGRPTRPTTTTTTAPNRTTVPPPPPGAGGQPAGVYVTNDLGRPLAADVLQGDVVTGGMLRLTWSELEVGDDRWDWSALDAATATAAAADKRLLLAIVAGGATPSYVYDRHVAKLDFTIVAHQGDAANCTSVSMPPPWDATYLSLVDRLAHRVADHLSTTGHLGLVQQVKVTGINQTTAELRLPADPGLSTAQSGCPASNALATWQAAGYSPELIMEAFRANARSWATAFPAAALDTAILPKQSLPDLDASGPTARAGDATLTEMMTWASTTYGARFAVSYNALKLGIGSPLGSHREQGIPIGFQIAENQFGNPTCAGVELAKGRPTSDCSPEAYRQAIDLGQRQGMAWLEVFQNTVRSYRDQTRVAARALEK